MKQRKLKLLCSSVIGAMLMSSPAFASEKKIGDLEIYKVAEQGAPTLTLMLDTSGSMDIFDINGGIYFLNPYNNSYRCDSTPNLTQTYNYVDPSDTSSNFSRTLNFTQCTVQGVTTLNRLDILKQALVDLLISHDKISSDTRVALGNYSVNGQGSAGQIILPANKLNAQHRANLIDAIIALDATGNTPTAQALAEAGAYMLGTTTKPSPSMQTYLSERGYYYYSQKHRRWLLLECRRWRDNPSAVQTVTNDGSTYDYRQNCRAYSRAQSYYNPGSNVKLLDSNNRTYYYSVERGLIADPNANIYSGFDSSDDSTKVTLSDGSAGDKYSQAAQQAECAGNGIYLLTDGLPNSSSSSIATALMNTSLEGSSLSVGANECDLLEGSNSQAWGCMAAYARKLRDTSNPSGISIKLATAGLGSAFAGLPKTIVQIDGKEEEIYDCDDTSVDVQRDTRNLCRLGEKTYGFGEGGFTHLTTADDIKKSISRFLSDMVDVINTSPSGTISVPADPLSTTNVQPYAYLPMLDPQPKESSVIWPGNLKKYHVKQGTLYGQSDSRLYKKPQLTNPNLSNTFPYALNPAAKDIWMGSDADNIGSDGTTSNNAVDAGGVYARLKAPGSTSPYSVRNVLVEDIKSAGSSETRLVKVGVDSSGSLVGFDSLIDPIYTPIAKAHLLNFLGYEVSVEEEDYQQNGVNLDDTAVLAKLEDQLLPPNSEIKVLGGVVHSKPELVSYGGEFYPVDKDTINNDTKAAGSDGIIDPDAGQITNDEDDREDYILFGSMDGALHLVDAQTGEENFAVIPKVMIETQLDALKKLSVKAGIGQPVFGVDAPWTTTADYQYDLSSDDGEIQAKNVRVYGGLRMGGVGVYGLDVSNKDTPKMLFSITRGKGGEFKRLGQTWSKPLVAKIKTGAGKDDVRDVLVFGGGYDMCFENPEFKLKPSDGKFNTDNCDEKAATYGNAVYMVDAKTGEKLWSWNGGGDGGANNTTISDMKYSVVGGITGLDRNGNGTLDHLYFADLGGQVFRIDLLEGVSPSPAMTKNKVKIFSANANVNITNHIPFRFYERPIVSFYDNASERFAVVNVASGDRSSPLSEERSVEDANRVYGIIDRDVAQQGLYGDSFTKITKNFKTSNLTALPFNENNFADKDTAEQAMRVGTLNQSTGRFEYTSQGWYYPMIRFDGYNKVPNVKSMGEGTVIGGYYYMTAYSPNMNYGEESSCTAKVAGGSERQLYCMPYGICKTDTSKNGTGGFTRAGPGIQELVLGPLSNKQRQTKVLIGTQTLAEITDTDNRIDYGEGMPTSDVNGLRDLGGTKPGGPEKVGGDGSAPTPIFSEGFKLVPDRWYELQNNE